MFAWAFSNDAISAFVAWSSEPSAAVAKVMVCCALAAAGLGADAPLEQAAMATRPVEAIDKAAARRRRGRPGLGGGAVSGSPCLPGVPVWLDDRLDESGRLHGCGLECIVDAVKRIEVRDERRDVEQPRAQQAQPGAHPGQDHVLLAEVGVDDVEGHPVPVAEADVPSTALVISDD